MVGTRGRLAKHGIVPRAGATANAILSPRFAPRASRLHTAVFFFAEKLVLRDDLQPMAAVRPAPHLTIEVVSGLGSIEQKQWDGLVEPDDPFIEYAFLKLLEDSGSVGGLPRLRPGKSLTDDEHTHSGWLPLHLLARRDGALIGAMPLYLKSHSYGEYIFDWSWADAAARAGLDYYPKLVSAVPFTPVNGRRLLTDPSLDRETTKQTQLALLVGAQKLADDTKASSLHVLFCSEDERSTAKEAGFLARDSFQFHWENNDYESFDHYVASFRRSARKNVLRERKRAADSGLTLQTLAGHELDSQIWDALYGFYRDTTSRKWGQAYLTREFFELLPQKMADRVFVTIASEGARPVAGALFFQRGEVLYGRYWGCLSEFDSLHFELCYYRAIELCIQRKWRRFEAGAQGMHKIKRGLLPKPTYSSHWIRHRPLHGAVQRFLAMERHHIAEEMKVLENHGPFRRDSSAGPAQNE
jgi:predicted N-acyltransferase